MPVSPRRGRVHLGLPAGTVDGGEAPEESVRRELREEAGLEVGELICLGPFHADTGRLQMRSYRFYCASSQLIDDFRGEEGLTVCYVTYSELKRMILSGEFRHTGHLACMRAPSCEASTWTKRLRHLPRARDENICRIVECDASR